MLLDPVNINEHKNFKKNCWTFWGVSILDLLKIFRRKSFDQNLHKILSSQILQKIFRRNSVKIFRRMRSRWDLHKKSHSSEDLKKDLGPGYFPLFSDLFPNLVWVVTGCHLSSRDVSGKGWCYKGRHNCRERNIFCTYKYIYIHMLKYLIKFFIFLIGRVPLFDVKSI